MTNLGSTYWILLNETNIYGPTGKWKLYQVFNPILCIFCIYFKILILILSCIFRILFCFFLLRILHIILHSTYVSYCVYYLTYYLTYYVYFPEDFPAYFLTYVIAYLAKGAHTLLLRGGRRGFDPRQPRHTKRAFFPPLAI